MEERLAGKRENGNAGGMAGEWLLEVVEHPVHNDASDRNVEPDWERPTCEPAVFGELLADSEVERRQCKRQDKGGKDDMRNEDGEVDTSNPAFAFERSGASVVVVGQVGG